VRVPASLRGYCAPSVAPAGDMWASAWTHDADAAVDGSSVLSSHAAGAMDGTAAGAVVDGLEMRLVRRGGVPRRAAGGVPRPAAAAGVTRRAVAPLYDVTFAATASPPTTRHGGGGAADVDAITRCFVAAIDGVISRIAAPHSGARRAAVAGLEGMQQLSSSSTAARGVHAVTSHGTSALRQSALQGVVHCTTEELGSSPGDITSAASDANAMLPGRGGLLPAAADTYGTSLVAGVMRVARLTPSSAAAAAPSSSVSVSVSVSVSGEGSECIRLETLTDFVRQVMSMSKQAHERRVSFADMPMQRRLEASSIRDMTSALITGGLGILGQLVGGWVVKTTGASELILSGRSGRVSGRAASFVPLFRST